MDVIWKDIEGYEGKYAVSNSGHVWSYRTSRFLKVYKHEKGGHHRVVLQDGSRNYCWVHRLVLEAFVGSCPEGMECRHLDGNPNNNCVWNLAWGTRQQNHADKAFHGSSKGEKHWHAKNDEARVRLVRQLHKFGGMSYSEIAKALVMVRATVADIVSRRSWAHIGG